jgi:predicted anti-sigma-YlaC factor YlaD
MSCLKIADIYAYLEKEFSPAQTEKIEKHLSSCPRCREAVEERNLLAEAASSLPDLDMPADFAEQVMARIVPVKRRLPAWLIALAAGLSALVFFLIIVLIFSGKNALTLLANVNHSFWEYAKNATVFMAKLVTLLVLAGKVLSSLTQSLYKGLTLLTTLISPGVQIFIMTLTLVLFITLIYVLRKKFMVGEKT